jgi:hypothetical protein
LLAAGVPVATAVAAGPTSSWGNAAFQPDWVGTIDSVAADNSIVVNDRGFLLQPNTVFPCRGGGRAVLRPGVTVGLKYVPGPNGERFITEICVQ